MTAPEVIHQIEAAWRDVPYPGDDHIFTPDSSFYDGIKHTRHRAPGGLTARCQSP